MARRLGTLIAMALVAVATLLTTAQAQVPGSNGRIAYAGSASSPYAIGEYEIWTMDPAGGNKIRLTTNSVADIAPSFSPDGTKIVFERSQGSTAEIYVMDTDGSNVTRLTNNNVGDHDPSFSPDGTKIVFSRDYGDQAEIMRMRTDGTGVTRLTSNTALDLEPTYAPDGQNIFFTHMSNNGRFNIFRVRDDGTGSTQITDCFGNCMQPDVSGDGAKIVYTRWNFVSTPTISEVFVANADGSGAVMKTAEGAYFNYASFAPAGNFLVYSGGSTPRADLFRLNLSTGATLQLTNTSTDEYGPAWQPV